VLKWSWLIVVVSCCIVHQHLFSATTSVTYRTQSLLGIHQSSIASSLAASKNDLMALWQ
jgi:hypothetical protein